MPLLQMPQSAGKRHIDKTLTRLVPIQHVGHQLGVIGIASAQVEIQKPVAIYVAEIGPHRLSRLREVAALGHLRKVALAIAAIQPRLLHGHWLAHIRGGDVGDGSRVGGHEQVEVAVVVKVPKPSREAGARGDDAGVGGHIGKGAVALVAVESVGLAEVGHVQIGPAVPVVVAPDDGLGVGVLVNTGVGGHIGKGAVALVLKELAGGYKGVGGFVADVEVEVAIEIVVAPGGGLGWVVVLPQAGGKGRIEEGASTRIPQQRIGVLAVFAEPSPAQDEQVEAAVVVVVGLHQVESPQQPVEVGHLGPVRKGAVPPVAEKAQWSGQVRC